MEPNYDPLVRVDFSAPATMKRDFKVWCAQRGVSMSDRLRALIAGDLKAKEDAEERVA